MILFYVVFLFLVNFLILFGPLMAMGISQIKAYEPGDADWGVKLDDVRGQAEAKEEVRRVVTLWQSGEQFEQAGGKRERGLLMLGAPGTGKTMLSKAIATSFNCPFVSIPGSGFAQTFIGMDAVIVRYLAWKAKKLARKWGGQCIVFIDEIDAVGMRRVQLGRPGCRDRPTAHASTTSASTARWARSTPAATWCSRPRAWRERLFAARADRPPTAYRVRRPVSTAIAERDVPGRHVRRRRRPARAEPAAGRDGRHRQPAVRAQASGQPREHPAGRASTSSRSGSAASAAVPAAEAAPTSRSTSSAPATCPSRRSTRRSRGRAAWAGTSGSGRRPRTTARTSSTSTWARSPTTPSSTRDARATSSRGSRIGYSPAMIEQVCSMALTRAHHDGRSASAGTTSSSR